MNRIFYVLAVAALAWGCGTADPDSCEPGDRGAYPAGPIGKDVGKVIADLSFEAPEGGTYSLGDVFADEGSRLLLITSTAGWCGPCIEEQPKLAELHKEFGGEGLTILAAMFEDPNFKPATLQQVADWKERYKLPYRLVLDKEFLLGAYYNRTPPMNMLVDVDTMKILLKLEGFDEQVIRATIKSKLCL